jgi:hypothetical protein
MENTTDKAIIKNWITESSNNTDMKTNLIFRASRDGWEVEYFHG